MAQLIIKKNTTELHWISDFWESEIKRVFFLHHVPGNKARGFHRHKYCRMAMICLAGTVDVYVQSPENDSFFQLNSPIQILFLEPTDWRVMHNFSEDAVLMILADRHYSDTFYIETPYRPLSDRLFWGDNQ
ncbi:MAG: FdtA/QdtA family cupin domain-containing protein [Spirosomataceae bacterium]